MAVGQLLVRRAGGHYLARFYDTDGPERREPLQLDLREQFRSAGGRGEGSRNRLRPHQRCRVGVERESDGRHVEPPGGGTQVPNDCRMAQVHAVKVPHGHGTGRRPRGPAIGGGGDKGRRDVGHGRMAPRGGRGTGSVAYKRRGMIVRV